MALAIIIVCFLYWSSSTDSLPLVHDTKLQTSDVNKVFRNDNFQSLAFNTDLSANEGLKNLVRIKRQVLVNGRCPKGMEWHFGQCMTNQEYEQRKQGDDYDYK